MSKTQSKLAVTLSEATCCCWLGVWYYNDIIYPASSLQAFVTGCEDGTLYWEKFDGIQWVYIAPTAPGMYEGGLIYDPIDAEATGPGLYRVAMSKPKCCVTYSSVIEAYAPV